jgi:hypothetical protein
MDLTLGAAMVNGNSLEVILKQGEMILVSAGSGLLATVVVIMSISSGGRILTEVALVLVRHSKMEWRFWRELVGRFRNELFRWRRDD